MFEKVDQLTDLTGQLDAIRKVSATLRKQPQSGADELVTVLQEVSKTFTAFEGVLVRYLSLRFKDSTRDADVQELVVLQGGARKTVGEMRAHCSKIGDIYHDDLAAWFDAAALSDSEKQELADLFESLENSDSNTIIPAVDQLATWLELKVDETSTLTDAGSFKDAAAHVVAARREVAPLRKAMGRTVEQLRDLEIQFTA